MITIRKLHTLPPGTRLRKIAALLQGMEAELSRGMRPDGVYLNDLLRVLAEDESLPGSVRAPAERLLEDRPFSQDRYTRPERPDAADLIVPTSVLTAGEAFDPAAAETALRLVNDVRHAILSHLGAEPADWDLFRPGESGSDPAVPGAEAAKRRVVLPIRVYLDGVRSPFNVGSIFRTAESFGFDRVYLSEGTPAPTHPRALRTSQGTAGLVPWERRPLTELEGEEGVFALELGGTEIREFEFPERGVVIIGSEELGVSPYGRELAARSAGRVSIPTGGLKGSLGVSVAFGILASRWYAEHTP